MKINKKGFTLSEVLVALVVIGVIMALSVQTLKNLRASYTSLTYFALKNVKNIVQEAASGTHSTDGEFSITTTLCRENGKVTAILNPDKDLPLNLIQPTCDSRNMVGSTKSNFCTYITSIVNTSGEENCDYEKLFDVSINSNNEPYIVTAERGNFSGVEPTFMTTNGQKYYISKHTHNSVVSSVYGFRLLAVDLNGSSRPNISDEANSNKVPDVVTFLILDNGEIYPLGVAADNIELTDGRIVQYINAKLKGYYYDGAYFDGDGVRNIEREDNIPDACFATIRDKENLANKDKKNQLCNFSTIYQQNPARGDGKGTFFSFRQAYCGALGSGTPTYKSYCDGVTKNDLCPPSSDLQQFDLCTLETVKPAFRYEMK